MQNRSPTASPNIVEPDFAPSSSLSIKIHRYHQRHQLKFYIWRVGLWLHRVFDSLFCHQHHALKMTRNNNFWNKFMYFVLCWLSVSYCRVCSFACCSISQRLLDNDLQFFFLEYFPILWATRQSSVKRLQLLCCRTETEYLRLRAS